MAPMTCPRCQTIRASNSMLCHHCGYIYGSEEDQKDWTPASPGRQIEVTASFGTGFRFGAGFALGILVIGLIGGIASTILFASLLAVIVGAFAGALGG